MSISGENSSDTEMKEERGYLRVNNKRLKLENREKQYKNIGDSKRKKLNLKIYIEEFKDVFRKEEGKIKYCCLEKCKIPNEEGKRISKKGQMVPQALIADTVNHIESLVMRDIIRKSESTWRNPVRALRKPNGKIRLVSNFISLNDIIEKDDYKFANIRDVVPATKAQK